MTRTVLSCLLLKLIILLGFYIDIALLVSNDSEVKPSSKKIRRVLLILFPLDKYAFPEY